MKKLLFLSLLALSACSEPTSEQLAALAAQAAENERLMEAKQAAERPKLISEQDGVRLYRVSDTRAGRTVYFTTRGDASWEYRSGKVNHQMNVPGHP